MLPPVRWAVERTEIVAAWWRGLDAGQQEALTAALLLIQERGPALGRPLVDTLIGSRLPNLKELRVSAEGRRLRVLFAFDPRRVAVLLVGGDKTGAWRSWYQAAIPEAEALYAAHLADLKRKEQRP
ncbi:MAG: diaminopimelate decarboxylase [Chloroflexota bacterium]|nr:MAG: diaminopimelate decarboxylase [Chloroflexota bacterium]